MSFHKRSAESNVNFDRNVVSRNREDDRSRLNDRDASPPRRPVSRTTSIEIDNDASPRRKPAISSSRHNHSDDASPPRKPSAIRVTSRNHSYVDKDGDASPPRRTPSSGTSRGLDVDEKSSPNLRPPNQAFGGLNKDAPLRNRDGRDLRDTNRRKQDGRNDSIAVVMMKASNSKVDDLNRYSWGEPQSVPTVESGVSGENEGDDDEEPPVKPDFGLSGALAKDDRTGNMRNGVLLQFTESMDAAVPDKKWRLYVFKGDETVSVLHLHRKTSFLLGRDERVADVHLAHPSCSKQHAVIQFRSIKVKDVTGSYSQTVKPYLMDLKSANKTMLNGVEIDDARYYELLEGDVLKFGSSSRDYVLLHEQSTK